VKEVNKVGNEGGLSHDYGKDRQGFSLKLSAR